MASSYLVSFLCLAPVFLSLGGILLVRRIRGEHRRKKPFKQGEGGLRWAGYSLEQELQAISEKMDLALVMMIVAPALAVAMYSAAAYRHEASRSFGVGIVILALIGVAWAMVSLFRNAALSQRKRLGMRAEQLVGEVLSALMREGFYVFHDFPMDGWNIDHVVIGETGVFAVETKGRRKHKRVASGIGEYNLDFNGELISYPESQRFEDKPVKQARRAACGLEKFIEERAVLKLPVVPLLVFPGWYINRKGKSDVSVLGQTEVNCVVLDGKLGKLSKATLERVVAVVEAQCRDVVW